MALGSLLLKLVVYILLRQVNILITKLLQASSIVSGGNTWTLTSAPTSTPAPWAAIASDSSGLYLAAGQWYQGGVYISSDGK